MTRWCAFIACGLLLASCRNNASNVVLASLDRTERIDLLCAEVEQLTGNSYQLFRVLPLEICDNDGVCEPGETVTNCVADWVCAGHKDKGRYNLAVFLGACSFDCLFCQNSQYRHLTVCLGPVCTPAELAQAAGSSTGRPTPIAAAIGSSSRRTSRAPA